VDFVEGKKTVSKYYKPGLRQIYNSPATTDI